MAYELIIFPDPLASIGVGEASTSRGIIKVNSHPANHPTGRAGIGFTLPDDTINGHGFNFTLFHPTPRVPITQKGILWLNDGALQYPWTVGQQAALGMDDFTLPIAPTQPIPPPVGSKTPQQIINDVYRTGLYDLATKAGCGTFTEACCSALHNDHSIAWGHVKKFEGQEQYNGHSVDAIMLLNSMPNDNAELTEKGIYDIIVGSQAPGAKPGFNLVDTVKPNLWYYPA